MTNIIKYITLLLFVLFFHSIEAKANRVTSVSPDSIIRFVSDIYLKAIEDSENKESLYNYFEQEKGKAVADPSIENVIDFPIRTGIKLTSSGYLPEALRILKGTLNYLESENSLDLANDVQRYEIYTRIGIIYSGLGDENESLQYYLKAYQIAQETNWQDGLAIYYNNLSILYSGQGNDEKAEELLLEALKIYEDANETHKAGTAYNNLASLYVANKRYDEAIPFFEKALGLTSPDNHYLNAVLFTNISETYRKKKDYSMALEYARKSEELMNKTNNEELRSATFLNIAETYALMGNRPQALLYLKKAIDVMDKMNAPNLTKSAYKQVADIYSLLGDHSAAYSYLNDFLAVNDSVTDVNMKTKLMNLLSVHEVERLEFQNKELKQLAQIKELAFAKQRYLLISIIIISVLSLIFFVVIFRKTKSEKEKNALIAQQKEQMLAQEKILHQKNVTELQTEIDFRNRQLTSYTMNMAAVNEFHQKITQELETAKDKKVVDDVIKQITIYGNNFSNEEFKTYFENVHPNFYNNLLKTNPNLTPNDLRLCAFLRLGLSTKEIASLTFREISSVESSRNRLRKKLNLSSDENFQAYLSQF